MSKREEIYVAVGKGYYKVEIISSAILALVTFFYAYILSSFLNLQVYTLKDRVVYENPFEQYVIGPYIDHLIISVGLLIWLCISLRESNLKIIAPISYGALLILVISVEPSLTEFVSLITAPIIIILFLFYQNYVLINKGKEIVIANASLYLMYLSLILIVISVVYVIISLLPTVSADLSREMMRDYPYEIFVMLSPISAMLMVLLVFAFPLKLIIRELVVLLPNIFKTYFGRSEIRNTSHNEPIPSTARGFDSTSSRQKRTVLLVLLLILALSSGLTLIPYQPAYNEDGRIVGVDTDQYALWVNNLMESYDEDLGEFLSELLSVQGVNGDRPLSLFFIFVVVNVSQASSAGVAQMIDYSPVVLAPLLVLSVYFLTRQLSSNYITPLLAAFLTTISFQVLAGLFAGFYANWVALIIGYFCLGYLFKFLKEPRRTTLAVFSVLLIATLFAHVYTWTVISFCAGSFVILLMFLRRTDYSRKAAVLALVIIAASAVIDISKSLATASASGIVRDLEFTDAFMGPSEFTQRWEILQFVVNSSSAGVFGNSIVILLGLYWVWRSNIRETSTLFLLVFLSIGIIPLFFGDWIIQSRTLYMIPFQIPASFGLSFILFRGRSRGREYRNVYQGSTQTLSVTSSFYVVAICALLTAIGVTVLTNLYLVIPF